MRLKTKILTLLFSALSFLYTEAQDIAAVWEAMPAHIMPSIGKNARLDMIDLYNAGMRPKPPPSPATLHASPLWGTIISFSAHREQAQCN